MAGGAPSTYDDPVKTAQLAKVILPRGTVVNVNGMPVTLEVDAIVACAPVNVPLLFEDEAPDEKLDRADGRG